MCQEKKKKDSIEGLPNCVNNGYDPFTSYAAATIHTKVAQWLRVRMLVLVYLPWKTLHSWKFGIHHYNLHYSKAQVVWFLCVSNTCPKTESITWMICLNKNKRSSFLETKPYSTTDSGENIFFFYFSRNNSLQSENNVRLNQLIKEKADLLHQTRDYPDSYSTGKPK